MLAGKHIVQYIERIIVTVREKLIKEYDEQIIILKEKHRCQMEERERHHREIYLAAIRRAWESYEKSMEEIEFVKEVRFKIPGDGTKADVGRDYQGIGSGNDRVCAEILRPRVLY